MSAYLNAYFIETSLKLHMFHYCATLNILDNFKKKIIKFTKKEKSWLFLYDRSIYNFSREQIG